MAKTKASTLRAIVAWQARYPAKVKAYQAAYEARHKARRQKERHDWYMAHRSAMRRYPHLSTQAAKEKGLQTLREREGKNAVQKS